MSNNITIQQKGVLARKFELSSELFEKYATTTKQWKGIDPSKIDTLKAKEPDGIFKPINPEDVKPGMHIQLECQIWTVGMYRSSIRGVLDIPNVQQFEYIHEVTYEDSKCRCELTSLLIESKETIFSDEILSDDIASRLLDLRLKKKLEAGVDVRELLAEKCIFGGNKPRYISNFDIKTLQTSDSNIKPEDVKKNIEQLSMKGTVHNIETGQTSHCGINICPLCGIDEFEYKNEQLYITGGGILYSTIDFSKEWHQMVTQVKKRLTDGLGDYSMKDLEHAQTPTELKRVERLNKWIDYDALQKGKIFSYLNKNGRFVQIKPEEMITSITKNGHVFIETKYHIFATYDPRKKDIENLKPRKNPSIEVGLAEKCFKDLVTPNVFTNINLANIYTIDIDKTIYDIDLKKLYKYRGLIIIPCSVRNLETQEVRTYGDPNQKIANQENAMLLHVQYGAFVNGHLFIETNGQLYTTIDFSKEYELIKRKYERD